MENLVTWINWYDDKNLIIKLSVLPDARVRYVTPFMTEEQKKEVREKPFICKNEVWVKVIYKKETYEFKIEKDFKWDGASIPRFCWRLVGSPTDNKYLIASMIHDKMCNQKEVVGYNRYLSTLIYTACLKAANVNPFIRWCNKHSVDNWQKFQGWNKGAKQS